MAPFESDEDSERVPHLRDGAHREKEQAADLAKSQINEISASGFTR